MSCVYFVNISGVRMQQYNLYWCVTTKNLVVGHQLSVFWPSVRLTDVTSDMLDFVENGKG